MPPPSPELARWFHEEIQPHEPKLRAWVKTRFPFIADVDDLVQDTYVRLFRSKKAGNLSDAQPYLYAMARNAAMDQIRRRRIVQIDGVPDLAALPIPEDSTGTAEQVSRLQELELLAEAIESLPDRCRQIVKLRKLRGLSYEEIATAMGGISVHTVNAQLVTGLARCRAYLQERRDQP